MADLSLTIDLLLQGAQQIANLRKEIDALGKVSQRVNTTTANSSRRRRSSEQIATRSTKSADEEARASGKAEQAHARAERATLAHARAVASLQSTAGHTAAAIRTLEAALARVDRSTTAAVRAGTQLASLQNKLSAEATKSERAIASQASTLARVKQSAGDTAGAMATLRGALDRLTAGTLPALRLQKQLNDLGNDYANSPLINAVRGVGAVFSNLFPSLRGAAAGFGSVASQAGLASAGIGAATVATGGLILVVLSLVAAFVAAAAAGAGFVSLLENIAKTGIEANAQIEQTRIGIATVIASVATIRDEKGIELNGLDALNRVLPISDDLLRRLRVESLKTALSFQDLSQGLLQALGPGLAAGLSESQILDTVVSMSQLVGPLTGQVQQLGQELRALLSGEINPRSAQVATALGITPEDIKRAKQAGTLAQFLAERLKVAAATGKILGETFSAATTNLQEAFTIFSGEVTRGLFEKLRDSINRALPTLFDEKSANLLSARLSGLADTFTRIFNAIGGEISDVVDFILRGIEQISRFLDDNRQVIAEIIQTVDEIVRGVASLIGLVLGVASNTDIWKGALAFVNSLLQETLGRIFQLRAIVVAFGSGIKLIGSIILSSVLQPLSLAARAIAAVTSGIPGLGTATAAIAEQVTGFYNSATESVKSSANALAASVREVGTAATQAQERIKKAGLDADRRVQNQNRPGGNLPRPRVIPRQPKDDDKKKKAAEDSARELFRIEQTAREALLALRRAETEKALDLARIADDEETASLERALENRLISIADYYAQRLALSDAATKRESAALEQSLQEERAALAEIQRAGAAAIAAAKPSDRRKTEVEALKEEAQQKEKILGLEVKLAQTQSQGRQQQEDLTNKLRQQRIELIRDIEDVQTQLLEATGSGFEAASRGIAARFKELLKRAIIEFGADSGQVLAIKNLQAALLAEAGLRAESERFSTAQTNLDIERLRIQNDLNRGVITERQARQEILALERAKAKELDDSLARQQKIAEALFGPNSPQVAGIRRQREELKQLGVDGETAFKRIGDSIEGGFTDTLDDIFTRTKSIGEAFSSLLSTVLKTVSRIASEEITDAIFNRKPRNADAQTRNSGLAGVIDKIFGRNKTEQAKTNETIEDTTDAVHDVRLDTTPRLDTIIRLLQAMREQQRTDAANESQARGDGSGGLASILTGGGGGGGLLGILAGVLGRQSSTSDTPVIRGEDGSIIPGGETGGSLPDKLSTLFNTTISKLGGFFKTIFGGLFSGLKTVFGGAVEGFSGVIGKLGGLFSGGAGGALGGIVGKLGGLLKPIFSAIGGFFGFGGGFASGGAIRGPGGPRADKIPIWTSNGEHVITARAASRWGHSFFDGINAGLITPPRLAFADGGAVDAAGHRSEISITGKNERNLTLMNILDEDEIFNAFNSTAGEDLIINIIRRASTRVKQVLKI